MSLNTRYRSTAPEIMDDFALEGEMLRDALDKIEGINQWLGGNQVTLDGVKRLINGLDTSRTITFCDLGCGNGAMLRSVADFGLENNLDFQLVGIDANAFTINHAQRLSLHYPNIKYNCSDIFAEELPVCDIFLCTLTLHHFKDGEIVNLLRNTLDKARLGIVVNDLHRSALAYRLFQIVCRVFCLNRMSREDGLVSILRGFRHSELALYAQKLNLKKYRIRWKWAFRYQWIIFQS